MNGGMPAGFPKSYTNAIVEVRAVYKELATLAVERNCSMRTECCQFKITGRVPYLTKGEALVAAQAFRATGRKRLPQKPDGSCPLLDASGRCLIYENRPFGCRTHFCKAAGGDYERRQVAHLIHRLEAIDIQLHGQGPQSLQVALAQQLD